ncbi:MAG: ASKHA domain-containing protein [Halofilum sp. (in: g-proteobacteria)]|nr:ASKHA domain-containing protein [Halofilum sp. (in: g-proteobacteria)]
MADADALVVFTPSGRRGRFPVGTPVLQAARSLGVDIDSVCGGRGLCGRCQVLLAEGEFAKHAVESRPEHLTPFSETERDYQAQVGKLAAGRRLSCSTQILGDCVIDVPPDSQVHKQIVRKDPGSYDIELDPVVRMYYTEVQEPSMHDPSGDLRRLLEALEFEWRLEHITRCDLRVLQDLQPALRREDWSVSVAVHNDNEIIAVWPGFFDKVYGLAVDIGSTTVAAHLCDLSSGEVIASAGVMNPQIRFGEDLMSRVSYVMMNPGGEAELTGAVREALNDLVTTVCDEAGVDRGQVMEITFVGNPVMHHLLLGINPVELGGAPFALATDEATTLWASELELDVHKNARAYVLPCIAGHVGADTAGVVLSEKPHLRDEMTLLVDVGTNAEIVLGNRRHLMAASSPTGPAFEGAQISSGQRAANGAIERVRIDPQTLEPRFKVIGCDLWSNEEGFDEQSAAVGVNGICGSGIIEVIAEMYLARVINQDGVVDGRLAERSDRVVPEGRTWSYVLHRGANTIRVTQNDVRAIQLAKAALYAGVRLLMDRMHVERIDRIRLAGAFGNHIDVTYAMVLGLIPDCELEHVSSAGNAAGVGARIALLDRKGRREIEEVVRRIEKVETAIEPRFQEHFVEAMAIPHKTAAYPNLARVVELPAVDHAAQGEVDDGGRSPGTRRRRRRRRG